MMLGSTFLRLCTLVNTSKTSKVLILISGRFIFLENIFVPQITEGRIGNMQPFQLNLGLTPICTDVTQVRNGEADVQMCSNSNSSKKKLANQRRV